MPWQNVPDEWHDSRFRHRCVPSQGQKEWAVPKTSGQKSRIPAPITGRFYYAIPS